MDGAEFSPLKNFDKKLQQFYYDVIGKEVDLNIMWKAHSIRRALTEVVKAYKKRPRRKSDIRFDTPYRRCAYLLKHSPCFTSAVAKYFHSFVSDRQYLVEKAFKDGKLAICCLGGGPATDAVALVHIIRYMYEPYWIKCHKTLEINITVVDISEEWQDTAKNVLDCLKITSEFFGKDELALTYEFLTADLTEEMSQQLKTIIKSADIVTMIYFLSAVTGTRGRKTSETMVENIMLGMKKEAFVFFLDSAVDKHYEILNKASEKRNVMLQIYGPLVEEFHTISIESVETFLDLYVKHFHKLICMTYMFFCVSSWQKPMIKTVKKIINREYLSATPPPWKKPTDEESDDLTRKMKQYRSTVFRLVNKRCNTAYNEKSNNGFGRKMLSSRNFGKKGFEKKMVDSNNTSGFANSRSFRKTDIQKSDASNNNDFESSRNIGNIGSSNKIDFASSGTNNCDIVSSSNFGKSTSANNSDSRNLAKIVSTKNSDFERSGSSRKTVSTNNGDFARSRNTGNIGSSNKIDFESSRASNCVIVSSSNFGKTAWAKNSESRNLAKIVSPNNSDFESSGNFRNIVSTKNSDFERSGSSRKTVSTNNSDFASSRNFEKIDLDKQKPDSINNCDTASFRNSEKHNLEEQKADSGNDNAFDTKQKYSLSKTESKMKYEGKTGQNGLRYLKSITVNAS